MFSYMNSIATPRGVSSSSWEKGFQVTDLGRPARVSVVSDWSSIRTFRRMSPRRRERSERV